MITVAEALEHLFALVSPLETETVPLTLAHGRTMVTPAIAKREQPPFAASAMDGYAVTDENPAKGSTWTVDGEAAAGHRFVGTLSAGKAVRIFTGAPVPEGTKRVIIQEDIDRSGSKITLKETLSANTNIRPSGGDFHIGDSLSAPRVLGPSDIALLASMNVAEVNVTRKPRVALIATGDELVSPGETPGPDQIIASNSYGLYALLGAIGAEPRLLPIARDTLSSLETVFELCTDADLVVTIGGASVGDHDLVAQAAADAGMTQSFYKVAMRPGKPLMAGKMGATPMIGLPGNPVSAMICGHIFLAPAVRAMLGQPAVATPRRHATMAAPLAANGPREHYIRGWIGPEGATAFPKQDSSLLTVLSDANCLIVQPPHDTAKDKGDHVEIIDL